MKSTTSFLFLKVVNHIFEMPLIKNKQLAFLLIISLVFQQINGQKLISNQLIRSTTGIAGFSETVTVKDNLYTIQQSIGQASVIGTFSTTYYTIRQGFIQPNVFAKIIDKNILLNLVAVAYPNPFIENISLSFNEEIKSDITVTIYDLLGRSLFMKNYAASQNINIELNHLSTAYYVLKATANNKQFIKKIMKK